MYRAAPEADETQLFLGLTGSANASPQVLAILIVWWSRVGERNVLRVQDGGIALVHIWKVLVVLPHLKVVIKETSYQCAPTLTFRWYSLKIMELVSGNHRM
jgi:hypothetical protein